MLQKNNEFPGSELCGISAVRDLPAEDRETQPAMFSQLRPLPWPSTSLIQRWLGDTWRLGLFVCLSVWFSHETVANLLTQSDTYCDVLFGPRPPVFVWTLYTQGTVPDRRTTALPEPVTDMGRVPRVELISCCPPTLSGVPLHFQMRLSKESFFPLSPPRPSSC